MTFEVILYLIKISKYIFIAIFIKIGSYSNVLDLERKNPEVTELFSEI